MRQLIPDDRRDFALRRLLGRDPDADVNGPGLIQRTSDLADNNAMRLIDIGNFVH